MLPELVWKMPKLGTFNLHASLLPNYRGAAPINWAIINGDTKTGVTTFFIDDKIDTGAIILSSEIEITSDENTGQLHDKLNIPTDESFPMKAFFSFSISFALPTEQSHADPPSH